MDVFGMGAPAVIPPQNTTEHGGIRKSRTTEKETVA